MSVNTGIICSRNTAKDPHFVALVKELDAELAVRDGKDYPFYSQFNGTDVIPCAVVAYFNGEPVGCGAIKAYDKESMEVKRMYVKPAYRGKGVASAVLHELEQWAREQDVIKCVLETGKRQHEAIRLYNKRGYVVIPNYGPYAGVENSVCFQKTLKT